MWFIAKIWVFGVFIVFLLWAACLDMFPFLVIFALKSLLIRKMDRYRNILMCAATSLVAGVVACMLLLSSFSRFHHHDSLGAVHYSLVCVHDDVYDEDAVHSNNHHSHGHLPDDDDDCALHLDAFYFDKSHDNSWLHYLTGLGCCCQALLDYWTPAIVAPLECVCRIIARDYDFRINEFDLQAATLRGPPYSILA